MNFSEQLNYYIEEINCTSKELSEITGISTPVISRFRNGKKIPNLKNNQLKQLSNGIFKLAYQKGLNFSEEEIYSSFSKIFEDNIDMEILRKNFNELVNTLNINISELAYSMGFSPSLISKIKSGQRNPYKPHDFAVSLSQFIVDNFKTEEEKKSISALVNCPIEKLSNDNTYSEILIEWLSNNVNSSNYINNFLNNLDEFNLNEYIKSIHFDEMKVPYIPFYKMSSKKYFGIKQMQQGELDFFKATVLSKSNEPVFMCNDMPMEDMSKDVDFGKKWMFSIAITLKRGLHLNIIHDINRPFNEMMLGLESWIPLYMTGQVSPYYLKNYKDNTYCHCTYVSGSVALTGECIKGYHNKGSYFLTTNKYEVKYYKIKAETLLNIAKPLMEIYRESEKNAFNAFILSSSTVAGNRRRILPSLPLHTISENLLLKILNHNELSKYKIKSIVESVNQQKEIISTILKNNTITDDIEELSEKEFYKHSPSILFSNTFCEDKINYSYDEYLEHLNLTKQFAENNQNYNININKTHVFKNIQITILDKEFVMISKNTNPTIHFVIYHPKLREAIENFTPPILEEQKRHN